MNSPVVGKAKTLSTFNNNVLEMYPEDFNEPNADFATLMRLIEFGRIHKIIDVKTKARQLRETYKRRVMDEIHTAILGRTLCLGFFFEIFNLVSITQIPSMEQYIFSTGYDALDFDTILKLICSILEERIAYAILSSNIAEQLTFWDAELFKELLPQQCQGRVWNKKNKQGLETVYIVRATIDQFNAVVQKLFQKTDCRPDFRAKIIAKWIDVARELRALKNFSSLKAIISTLQSEPVHRLKSTWTQVPNASIAQFRELASIFDADDDGTAKKSPLRRPQLIQNCRTTKSDVNLAESQGTVPYLGTFLTDLSMIDQANPDFTEATKEFEVIAKIRLFQSACRAYKIPMDMAFCSVL
uniref:Ras-GEF domain-containing protein n=1 Tax=Wuchereria bancrofti TaxID=6293 RepID=A0A1I8ESF4_WUCBA